MSKINQWSIVGAAKCLKIQIVGTSEFNGSAYTITLNSSLWTRTSSLYSELKCGTV